jgi:hypothetical protein
MTLPDDVAIRTTNRHGNRIKQAHELHDAWHEGISFDNDYLAESMIDCIDELDAVIVNSLHGFYRQAVGGLRNVLELVAIGAYCQVCNESREFSKWRAGKNEIRFSKCCNQLREVTAFKTLDSYLDNAVGDSIFNKNTNASRDGWARRLYDELCKFSHSRPAYTNVDMWESNGPIYRREAFDLTMDLLFQTYALCLLLVKVSKPNFVLPKPARRIYKAGKAPWTKVAHISYRYLFQSKRAK